MTIVRRRQRAAPARRRRRRSSPVSARAAFRAKHGEPALWAPAASSRSSATSARRSTRGARPAEAAESARRRRGADRSLSRRRPRERPDRCCSDDIALLDDVGAQLRSTSGHGPRVRGADGRTVDNVLLEMERRGPRFLRRHDADRPGHGSAEPGARAGRGSSAGGRRRAAAESRSGSTELIDWLVDADFRQWQRVTRHLCGSPPRAPRPHRRQPDDEESRRVPRRAAAHGRIGRPRAQKVVDTYDRRREASELADGARNAVAAAAAAGAGAAGAGHAR